jgi:hypothetical protein
MPGDFEGTMYDTHPARTRRAWRGSEEGVTGEQCGKYVRETDGLNEIVCERVKGHAGRCANPVGHLDLVDQQRRRIAELEAKLKAEHDLGRKMFQHSEAAWAMIGRSTRNERALENALIELVDVLKQFGDVELPLTMAMAVNVKLGRARNVLSETTSKPRTVDWPATLTERT